jgi:hypothetical protein
MDGDESRNDLLTEAIETAAASLSAGAEPVPLLITDRWGDRQVQQFPDAGLPGAKAALGEFVRAAAGDESCALVYVALNGDDQPAIVVERGQAGRREADVFMQRFRRRRGWLHGFKLIGEPKHVGATESVP